jgi:hypothetical protein
MNYDRDFLEKAHRYCNSNYEQSMESGLCGCFYCCRTFKPKEITEWVDDKGSPTAICPYCSIDSVICDKSGLPIMDENFLKEMYALWFLT